MGKGYNNYMSKKFFHPGNKDNIKRVWMAQQKTEFEQKKQEEMMEQYKREQEVVSQRILLGDEKAKAGLSFMYDPPPGAIDKADAVVDEKEFKFEWQRKYNAPRETYAKGDSTIMDQPFGIEVRNTRCVKCRTWGHMHTDRICPLYNVDCTMEPPLPGSSVKKKEEEDGEGETDPMAAFLHSLTPMQKQKLFKKLDEKSKKTIKRTHKEKDGSIKKKTKHDSSDNEEDRHSRKRKRRHDSYEENKMDSKEKKRRDERREGKRER